MSYWSRKNQGISILTVLLIISFVVSEISKQRLQRRLRFNSHVEILKTRVRCSQQIVKLIFLSHVPFLISSFARVKIQINKIERANGRCYSYANREGNTASRKRRSNAELAGCNSLWQFRTSSNCRCTLKKRRRTNIGSKMEQIRSSIICLRR